MPNEVGVISKITENELGALFLSPDIYVRDMDWKAVDAICVRMSRDTYSRSNFLDHRTVSLDGQESQIPIGAVMDAYSEQQPEARPVSIIAHTALCGSTLLSNCLDMPGVCLPCKEPYLLHKLSGIWRLGLQKQLRGKLGRSEPPILDLALALTARTYQAAEKPVIKLSDTCTSLLPSMLAWHPGTKILLLYHELRRFLVAMLRYPDRRQYIRDMQIRAEVDLRAVGKSDLVTGEKLGDGRCAALVWIGQMYPYLRLLAARPDRIRSLNATKFFADPAGTLGTLDLFFGLDIGHARLENRLSEGLLARNAKDVDLDFDSDRYEADLEIVAADYREEIDDAVAWAECLTNAEPIPQNLPNAL